MKKHVIRVILPLILLIALFSFGCDGIKRNTDSLILRTIDGAEISLPIECKEVRRGDAYYTEFTPCADWETNLAAITKAEFQTSVVGEMCVLESGGAARHSYMLYQNRLASIMFLSFGGERENAVRRVLFPYHLVENGAKLLESDFSSAQNEDWAVRWEETFTCVNNFEQIQSFYRYSALYSYEESLQPNEFFITEAFGKDAFCYKIEALSGIDWRIVPVV